jgi:hypothetical protein
MVSSVCLVTINSKLALSYQYVESGILDAAAPFHLAHSSIILIAHFEHSHILTLVIKQIICCQDYQ